MNVSDEQTKELAYDLRQIYANLIVGEHLQDIAQARKQDNYILYYKSLIDLKRVTKHKWKNYKDVERFNEMVHKAAELANKHQQVWLGKTKEPKACAEIENSLGEIEEFLYEKLEEAKMFGSKEADDEDAL